METPKNILRAIAGESMARNKYTYFASQAKKEGLEQISAIFIETADNEKEHAKRLVKLLKGGETSTLENYEHNKMYPEFAKVAKEEGFFEAATVFAEIGEVEEWHEKRYLKLKANIENDEVFVRDGEVYWKCRNCGYVHKGTEAPHVCPACAHPQAYYEILSENY